MEINITYAILGAILILAIVLVKKSLVIIAQSETKIVERLGKYHATLKPGINVIIPFVDRAKTMITMTNGRYHYTNSIDLREQVYDFDKQNVITKDNVQTQINALLYFQIVDPFKAVYEINNLPNAIEKLTQTTLRNIIGELELDETLTSRDTINTKLRAAEKFLKGGDRLKVTVRFRGRQMAHTQLGEELLTRFAEGCSEVATVDKNAKLEGRNMAMFLSPKPQGK